MSFITVNFYVSHNPFCSSDKIYKTTFSSSKHPNSQVLTCNEYAKYASVGPTVLAAYDETLINNDQTSHCKYPLVIFVLETTSLLDMLSFSAANISSIVI